MAAVSVITSVQLRLPCPACKHEANWQGTRAYAGTGTIYRIHCENCDSGKHLLPVSEATK